MTEAEVDSTEPRFETFDALKTYAEISDMIAEPLSLLVDDVQRDEYADWPLDVDLIRHFHRSILQDVAPAIAGEWRTKLVRVGQHIAPDHWHVDRLMREFFGHLNGRIEYVNDDPELQIEALAFAECSALNIHPFDDFNGRAVRVLALEMVRRFDLPVARAWVEQGHRRAPNTKRRYASSTPANRWPRCANSGSSIDSGSGVRSRLGPFGPSCALRASRSRSKRASSSAVNWRQASFCSDVHVSS